MGFDYVAFGRNIDLCERCKALVRVENYVSGVE